MAADPGAEMPAERPFPRAARLTRPREFKRVFQKSMNSGPNSGLSSGDRYFKVLARAGSGHGMRLGMAVSRKVDRHANVRNRIKRVVRESFRLRFPRGGGAGPGAPALDFVVLPRQAAATISNAELFRSLDRHWARIMAQSDQAQRERAATEAGPTEAGNAPG